MTETGPIGDGDEIDRLVLKGLRAPLSAAETVRLDALTAASPAAAARAQGLVDAWMQTGVIGRERIEQLGAAAPPRRWLIGAGLGAAAAAVAGVAWFGARPAPPTIYQAPADGPLRAVLADGSHIMVSRGGRLEARLAGDHRHVRLVGGEAFFEVAKDARRPFQVETGEHRLTVLGTRFNVDPGADGLRVSLLEGSLRVERTGEAAVVLKPGEQYRAGHGVARADVAAAAAWTEGRLVFDDASLGQAAVDIGRHTGLSLTFADPALAGLRFSGVLQMDRTQDWPAAFETLLPVRLSRTDDGYRVARR